MVRSPGYFVLASVLTRLPHLLTAQTVSPARLLLIDIDGLHTLLARDVGLANALLRAEALNFRALVRQVQDLKLRTAAQRLGCYLLALADDPTRPPRNFRLPFDKRLLAARLGCRQENLSRAFAALRSVGCGDAWLARVAARHPRVARTSRCRTSKPTRGCRSRGRRAAPFSVVSARSRVAQFLLHPRTGPRR